MKDDGFRYLMMFFGFGLLVMLIVTALEEANRNEESKEALKNGYIQCLEGNGNRILWKKECK